jgi:chromate transporter
LKLGFVSFGGPAGQIALMHQELVDKRKWISEERFLHALNYCMLLPGPEAQQLATYIGWALHRTKGGLVAGILFVLPGSLLLWLLSWMYVVAGNQPWMSAVFYGLKPAVLALIASALLRLGGKALKTALLWVVAVSAFVLIYVLKVPFPAIVMTAAAVGFLAGFTRSDAAVPGVGPVQTPVALPCSALPSVTSVLRTAVLGGVLWWAPVLAARIGGGANSVFYQQGLFFSKASLVTFGGAYAVLPYVSQQAVEAFGWLSASQMLDGLALAETTPGPLIIVLEFVGFLGAWNAPGRLGPLLAGTVGALMTVWCTFAPSFLWIFLGAPFVERVRGNQKIAGALAAVTAAVVGVILNLAVWFGQGVLFPKGAGTGVDWAAFLLGAGAFVGMVRWKWSAVPVILGTGALGALYRMML